MAITNILKSVGKEFLANKAAYILGGSDKTTPTETAQNDIPVDLSETTSMEDTYEPTVSNASENDPGNVEPENYELQPLNNTNEELPQEELDNLADFFEISDELDNSNNELPSDDNDTVVTVDSNDSAAVPDTDNEPVVVSQESTKDSSLNPERPLDAFQLANYNKAADRGTMIPPDNLNSAISSTNERPLDAFSLRKYNESTDRGIFAEKLYNADDKETVESLVESNPEESAEVLPDDIQLNTEAEQIINDDDKRNDEVNNDAVEDFLKQLESEKAEKPVDDGGTDFDYGRAYVDKVELNDAAKKAAEDLGLGNLDPEVKHGYYGNYGDTMKFANKLEKYKKEGIKDKFKSSLDGLSYDQLKQAAKSRKNAASLKTTLKEARAEKAYLDGKGSVLQTKPSVYWPKERFDEYKAELAKEINRYENYDNVADKTLVLSRLAQKAKFVNQVEEALKYYNAANGIDVNTYNEKPTEKRIEEDTEGIGKFINSGVDWDNVKVYKPGEDALDLVSGYRYDENGNLIDEHGDEVSDYEPIDTEGGVLLHRDEDFLGQDEWVDEEGNIHDYYELANSNPEALDKKWYEGDESGEGEYSESGNVNLDNEAADLQNQIEEAEALPVTNAEEAKEKQNKLRALRLKLKEVQTATGHGSSVPSAGPTTDNGIQNTGGRVSPRAGIGSIGGGAAGHGSMASTRPTKTGGDSHNSIASKAPLPQALEDNQGRVVSVNGKATTAPSSNNNGAFRSGSFGLMSKAKSNLKSIPSKAPVSGGAEHMGSADMSNDLNLEDGKQILIERLKQLLAQLTDEEKKQMGFSPALNQWNGKALIRLDGYTLQGLIDKVEEHLGEK